MNQQCMLKMVGKNWKRNKVLHELKFISIRYLLRKIITSQGRNLADTILPKWQKLKPSVMRHLNIMQLEDLQTAQHHFSGILAKNA